MYPMSTSYPLLDVEGQPLDGAGGGPMLNQPWVMPPDGMGKGVDGAAGPGQWMDSDDDDDDDDHGDDDVHG